jgi:sugar-phosphatase
VGITECGAVLFDLDGVLVDSTACVARVWQRWAEEHGLEPDAVIKVAHGRRAVETVELLAPSLDSAAELVKLEERELEDIEGLTAIMGAAALLSLLPPRRWAVVTSGTRRLAQKRLRVAGLPLPEILISADEVSLGKPNPAPYLKAAELLGLEPSDCVVIEDAPAGIASGRRAGMRVLAVPTTYPPSELEQADVLLEALAQLRLDQGSGWRLPSSAASNGAAVEPIRLSW